VTPIRVPVVPYEDALGMQERAQRELRTSGTESLVVLTHPPVITLGRMADTSHVVASGKALRAAGIDVVRTTRGGDVTWHGPGQLVVYPILDIGRRRMGTRRYVETLLGCVLDTVRHHGVRARLDPGVIGVFVEGPSGPPAKIAALGVSVSRGITGHGVAINVRADMSGFRLIVPCGLADHGVASMHEVLADPPRVEQVAATLVERLRTAFPGSLRILP